MSEGPAYPRATPRRSLVMEDDVWEALTELARIELGHANASAMLRHIAAATVTQAREDGVLPRQRGRRR